MLPRPPGSRRLLSWPRLTYAYTVSGFTPSSSAASRVVSRVGPSVPVVRRVMHVTPYSTCIDSINIDKDSVNHGQSNQVHGRKRTCRSPDRTAPVDVPRGLAGVVVTDTALGDVRGREGFYHYRQYSAVELAERRSFEDVWHLMFHGELPDARRSAPPSPRAPRALRRLPDDVREALPAIARAGAPSGPARRAAHRALAARRLGRASARSTTSTPTARRADALAACAAVPTLLTALHRLGQGLEPVEPRDDLPYAANYLYMLTGAEPEPRQARAVEHYLISTIDHGFNASTFTARVDRLHRRRRGRLPGRRGRRALRAAARRRARAGPWTPWTRSARRTASTPGSANGSWRATGSWASATPSTAPRTRARACCARSPQSFGGPLVDFAVEVERQVEAILAELKPGRELHTNVEFYAGVVMELCGLPREMFTPTFCAARVVGWSANILEQAEDSKIIRPAARYVGTPAAAARAGTLTDSEEGPR